MTLLTIFKKSLLPSTLSQLRFSSVKKAIGYLFVLILLTSLPYSIILSATIQEGVHAFKEGITTGISSFTIEKGQFHSELTQPLISQHNGVTVIFDSTGTYSPQDVLKQKNVIAFLQKDIIFSLQNTSQISPYASLFKEKLTKKEVEGWIAHYESLLWIIYSLIIIGSYLFALLLKFIGVSVLAIIGLVLASILRKNINYQRLWILAAYTVTLPTILFAVFQLVSLNLPFSFSLYWGFAIVLFYLVLRKIPSAKKA
ncbi:hypothetical protein A374_10585 [Fictibacillus macauensis ZFHKF-1]|uniref:DUF1189 domain-containing protein n=1 Tax=Fictibacillus macauensis ZFHKF-1 TaxID=1196324 RepID=I8UEE9_9BACL|nr:DUF1189 domain-containing protein [Fictibacillus macauensis]EIT85183.1 hypothetical protein A374_10585 [Fictibacillus macauensis ZFHKF-1]